MRKVLLRSLVLGLLLMLFQAFSAFAAVGDQCEVNWGDGLTTVLSDGGCKYNGSPRVGQVPDGWYADTERGNASDGPGSIFLASAVTLRKLDGSPASSIGPPPPPQFVFGPSPQQAPTPAPSLEVGKRCEVNFGNAPTVILADDGCKYEGPTIVGGVPEGWFADTPEGRKEAGSVFAAAAVTLRPLDGHQVRSIGSAPGPPPPSAPSAVPAQSLCPTNPVEAWVQGTGLASNDYRPLSWFTPFVEDGSPLGRVWKYNQPGNASAPPVQFYVQGGWTVDDNQGTGRLPGSFVDTNVFTLRCQR